MVEVEVGGEVGTDELADAVKSHLGDGAVDVVNDGDPESRLEELEHGVDPDEACPASDEDGLVR